jgi:phosphoesterase RecJ-like protein
MDTQKLQQLVEASQKIIIMQADNPDGDSLGSALALEQILGDMGKETYLYGAVDMPGYLKYLSGWSRVNKDLPSQFDLSIIVDASTMTLFDKLEKSGQKGWLAGKPCIVLDHHLTTQNPIPFATITINDPKRASTGELIYLIGKQLNWPLSVETMELLMTSILGDTQGLSNSLASAETYRVMAEFVEAGVDRPRLEETRREFSKMPASIFKYKATLIQRTELLADGVLALVDIPQAEINAYSPLYNPAPLIQTDMLQTEGVGIAIVLKRYDDGHVTGAIRCNAGYTIGAELAEHFGGGGHPYASGFKVADGRSFSDIKSACIAHATELLATLKQGQSDEATQHSHPTT